MVEQKKARGAAMHEERRGKGTLHAAPQRIQHLSQMHVAERGRGVNKGDQDVVDDFVVKKYH